MKLQEYDLTTRYQAEVLKSEPISEPGAKDEVRDIQVEVERRFNIKVGQNIGVLAPGRKEIGQEHHFRLYSVADVPQLTDEGRLRFSICVKRCSYIDAYSGEEFPGIASNYLCDLKAGDSLTVTGPYGHAFKIPPEKDANLIMIGAGTGIAPFRAFIKYFYQQQPDFEGHIWLFHGGDTGLDLLYRNRELDDFALYYDRETFDAINALAKRPGWSDAADWGAAMHARSEELGRLLSQPTTYVYVAGLEKIIEELDTVLAEIAGSNQTWFRWKEDLKAQGRWVELVY
jgi:ferredoxin--NADP+ reductase